MSDLIKSFRRSVISNNAKIVLNCLPSNPEHGIILYINYNIIEKIYKKSKAVNKFKKRDFKLYDQINDIHHITNLDHMALELSTEIKDLYSIDEFVKIIKNINCKTIEIYPHMPIKLFGNVKYFVNQNTLKLCYKNKFINIKLIDKFILSKNKKFIYDRLVFIIGQISMNSNEVNIEVGALVC